MKERAKKLSEDLKQLSSAAEDLRSSRLLVVAVVVVVAVFALEVGVKSAMGEKIGSQKDK